MPAAEVGALAAAIAIAVGARELPDVALLVPALAVAGVQAAVLGVVTRRIEILTAAPVLLCASWLTFASDALAGNPEWFTVPIGITLLVIEAILRAAVERRGERPGPPAIVAVDLVGMAFVVGAALVQTVATSLWYGVVAVVLGALLATWGVVTRVRRRAAFGAGTVLVALVLLIGLPLGDIALTSNEDGTPFEGPVLWLVIAGIGLIAIMAAAFLEQGRRRVRATVARIADLTRDWE
jgi:hypothetical protein